MGTCLSRTREEEYQIWLSRVQKDYWDLRSAPKYIKNNKRIALAAVKQHGLALGYASLSLQNDKEIVLIAVKDYGLALCYASPTLQNDKEVIMTAVKNDEYGGALQHASPTLQKDKDVVIAAVTQNGEALQHTPPTLQNDKDVVIAAVESRGYALKYASPTFKNDKEIVLIAVKQRGSALQHVSPTLQKDKEIVLIAVKQHPDNIKYAGEDMKRDPDVLIAAGMYDKYHDDADTRKQQLTNKNTKTKIVLSTRFSLDPDSSSQATTFTNDLKGKEYIKNNFIMYAPNAFDKKTCDPEWTNFDWPCRGTKDTCRYKNNVLTETGHPTDDCCWRYSFRCQLQEAKDTGGFMLQLVETAKPYMEGYVDDATLGKGQTIERDMAHSLHLKIFHVYRPKDKHGHEWYFYVSHIEEVVTAIRNWYDQGCKDMSECIIRPIFDYDDSDESSSGSE